ncbi:MAG: hypothetical protein ABUL62_13340 [Myxococcales bacterium]
MHHVSGSRSWFKFISATLALAASLCVSSLASAQHVEGLFVIENSRFFAVNPQIYNNWTQRGGVDWANTVAMASDGFWANQIQVIEDQTLWEIDPENGRFARFPGPAGITGTWLGQARMAVTFYNRQPTLFITESGRLWRVDWNGNYVSLGKGWDGATAIGASNSRLWITQANRLWAVNLEGQYTMVDNGYWGGDVFMTSNAEQRAQGTALYVVQSGVLWKVDTATLVRTNLTGTIWDGTTSISYLSGSVYIIRKQRLYQVNLSNNAVTLHSDQVWTGPTFMVHQTGTLPL